MKNKIKCALFLGHFLPHHLLYLGFGFNVWSILKKQISWNSLTQNSYVLYNRKVLYTLNIKLSQAPKK